MEQQQQFDDQPMEQDNSSGLKQHRTNIIKEGLSVDYVKTESLNDEIASEEVKQQVQSKEVNLHEVSNQSLKNQKSFLKSLKFNLINLKEMSYLNILIILSVWIAISLLTAMPIIFSPSSHFFSSAYMSFIIGVF